MGYKAYIKTVEMLTLPLNSVRDKWYVIKTVIFKYKDINCCFNNADYIQKFILKTSN